MLNQRKDKTYYAILAGLFLIVAVLSFFGLRPKEYLPENGARWLRPGPGLVFENFGIAHTAPADFAPLADSGFSIVMAIRPTPGLRKAFRFIMVVHDGEDKRQLVIGQWERSLIIMNGDDYSGRRKTPRIIANMGANLDNDPQAVFVVLTSDDSGTRIYLNGVLIRHQPALRLKWPSTGERARLVMGNSVRGRDPWAGSLSGLAVFAGALDPAAISSLHKRWRAEGHFTLADMAAIRLFYPFLEGHGTIAYDRGGSGIHLELPNRMPVLKKEVLTLPGRTWWSVNHAELFALDLSLNLIGFIPLGFFMAALLHRTQRFQKRHRLLSVIFCFVLSLTFELTQVWLPSRHSDMVDLMLNVVGGVIGVWLYTWAGRRLERASH